MNADSIKVLQGDCLLLLDEIAENSIDSCVTDPPYHLTTNKKGGSGVASINLGSPYGRSRIGTGNGPGGFMGKQWDGGDVAFNPGTWAKVYRVLKPGAHLLAFGGTRTYHRMACAIEDAGFEIRDCIMWIYGSGFPKSHDVSKGIDRAAGAKRKVVGRDMSKWRDAANYSGGKYGEMSASHYETKSTITLSATDAARQWEGWGTALKPACEPIILARKPLSEGTIAANVLKWGTGAINVEGARIPIDEAVDDPRMGGKGDWSSDKMAKNVYMGGYAGTRVGSSKLGRWPANVIHDGSEEVVAGFPETNGGLFCGPSARIRNNGIGLTTTESRSGKSNAPDQYGDDGSAARFFYTAKADADDRLGSKHPTVKPLDLMQYLVRLITPKGGTVLDPFAGTGTVGEAACYEGMKSVLIEKETEYLKDIHRRIELMQSGEMTRRHESLKAAGKVQTHSELPLFNQRISE